MDRRTSVRAVMNVQSLFAVPLVTAQWPASASLNPQLRELFLRREAEGGRWRNRAPTMDIPPGLFESSFDLFAWPEPGVQALHDFCIGVLLRTVAELNAYTMEDMRNLEMQNHCWFHITRRHGRFDAHNHPMASWSGVYCVASGRHDPDQPDSGILHFQNPHQHANLFLDQGNGRLLPAFSPNGRSLQLQAGQLVLFPSWLFHEVRPFHGDGERITVAFNCWFRPRHASSGRLGTQPLPLHG